jgi:hypothetical protein
VSFLDFFRRQAPAGPAGTAKPAGPPVEKIFAVPVLGRKFTTTGSVPKETYLFYAYLYEHSTAAAVARVRKEVREEGFEFLEQAGQVLVTTAEEWDSFVEDRFGWIKGELPTKAKMKDSARGLIHYSPKIMRS